MAEDVTLLDPGKPPDSGTEAGKGPVSEEPLHSVLPICSWSKHFS
jgi:hypothetical protein